MLISEYVEVIGNSRNIKYYTEKGYNIQVKKPVIINVYDLSHGSTSKVEVECDECRVHKNIEWGTYIIQTKNHTTNYYCINCCRIKTIKTNLEKYGVDSPLKDPKILEKVKTTNLEKWGHSCTLHSDKIKDKVKDTFIKNYGVEYPLKNTDIQQKCKDTLFKNHGVDSPLKSEEIKNKIKQTNLEKYGVENTFQSEEIKNKIKKTNLEKYGVEYSVQSPIVKLKIKNSVGENPYFKSDLFKKYLFNFHKEKYLDFEIIDYNFDSKLYTLVDTKKCNHTFEISNDLFNVRNETKKTICTICNIIGTSESDIEKQLKKWLSSNIEIIDNDRDVIKPKELDIYIPSHNLAIEFNGLYWHSEQYREKNYHLDKTLKCQEKGIQLLHVFEDDWLYKQEIVKSIILNKLGLISNKIYARKCIIKNVSPKEAKEFLDNNHIQGACKSSYKLGLYYQNELVSLMTFGYRKTNAKKEFELVRFCNKINMNVIGASSKLFKYFINNYKDIIDESYIISYSDLSLFDGGMYETLGFKYKHLSKPNYFWVINEKREHRFKYNKQILIKEGFDANKTEVEIMHDRGYYRIWGCGQVRWEYYLK